MITQEQKIAETRRRLELAEAALEDLKRDMLLRNEKLYDVMAEGYVDLVQSLRDELAGYLANGRIPPVESAPLPENIQLPK